MSYDYTRQYYSSSYITPHYYDHIDLFRHNHDTVYNVMCILSVNDTFNSAAGRGMMNHMWTIIREKINLGGHSNN